MTHIFFFIDPPTFNTASYAAYMWISTFLISYQGVFVSILYCFLNNEVKNVIKRHWLANFRFGSKFFSRRQKNANAADGGRDQRKEQQKLMGSEIPMVGVTYYPLYISIGIYFFYFFFLFFQQQQKEWNDYNNDKNANVFGFWIWSSLINCFKFFFKNAIFYLKKK